MDIQFQKNGITFIWNARKAATNPKKHDGITFEQAMSAFFDPFFKLLFVVHIEVEGEFIRLISARKATVTERNDYDF